MSQPIPTYAQQAYAILRNKFSRKSFPSDYLSWYISMDMVKKTLHVLERAGWIQRVDRGKYFCKNTDDIFRSMVEFRVPELLRRANMRFAYTEASAVEIWSDYTYIQRSWEHSPYYIKILSHDVNKWINYLRKHKVRFFDSKPQPALGEFVILKPQRELTHVVTYNNSPVDPLEDVVRYCEKYIDAFEYPLAYLKAKFGLKTKASIDNRVITEATKAVAIA